MRLIGTLKDPKEAARFCAFLDQKNIKNQLEIVKETDWGTDKYGDTEARIWVVEEDDLDTAMDLLHHFFEKPADPVFKVEPPPAPEAYMPEHKKQPPYILTLYFLIACVLLFAASAMTAPPGKKFAVPYPYTAIYSPEVTQNFLFDFPKAYEILETIVKTYGIEGLKTPQTMPPEGQALLKQYTETPYWQGFYQHWLNEAKGLPPPPSAPLFEKIREGQVWRLFTPALLHADIFHLLFNMLWLFVLGRQIEERVKPMRYLIFIFAAGIFSNLAQYLMSGPDFVGFSGILAGMFTFIWMRQRKAAWEGYQLQRSTMIFIGIFIGGMLLIQVASFASEVYANTSFAPPIANTAHFAGAFIGLLLGRMNFFAWKQ